jgi:SPP1 family predicted phage head-tail adaptor
MKAGKLRHRIIIQSPTETRNAYGEPEVAWGTFATMWATVEPLRGRELWAAAAINARTATRIRIRYIKDITPKMRVLYGSRVYLITAIIDEEMRHRDMQLMVEEWVAT